MKLGVDKFVVQRDDLLRFDVQKEGVIIKVVDLKKSNPGFIVFEDWDSFDYFFESMKKATDSAYRPKVRKRMDSLRMKAIQLQREFDKIKVR